MNDSCDILKKLEANGKRLESYKKDNENMFKRIDKQMKNFFMKYIR
jgi:hypothetical protein